MPNVVTYAVGERLKLLPLDSTTREFHHASGTVVRICGWGELRWRLDHPVRLRDGSIVEAGREFEIAPRKFYRAGPTHSLNVLGFFPSREPEDPAGIDVDWRPY